MLQVMGNDKPLVGEGPGVRAVSPRPPKRYCYHPSSLTLLPKGEGNQPPSPARGEGHLPSPLVGEGPGVRVSILNPHLRFDADSKRVFHLSHLSHQIRIFN